MMLEYWYVNNLLVQNRETRDRMIVSEFALGRTVDVRLAPRDEQGRWILPLNDSWEQ